MRLSLRGLWVLASAALAAALSQALSDALLAAAAMALAAVFAADLALYSVRRGACSCSPEVSGSLWVWETRSFRLEVECPGAREVRGLPGWLRLVGSSVKPGGLELELKTDFRYSGRYELGEIEIVRYSPLGLLSGVSRVRAGVSFRVLPRTLYWIIEALGVLGLGRGAGSEWRGLSDLEAFLAPLRSEGGVYYATREYEPGDSLRRVDWKATARTGRLHVKEMREPTEGSAVLILDLRCAGRYTCDAVASAALSVAVASARGLTTLGGVYDAARGRLVSSPDPRALLSFVLRGVLEPELAEELDLYEHVDPPTLGELGAALSKLGAATREVHGSLRRLPDWRDAVVVSALVHDVGGVLDVVEEAGSRGGEVVLLVPSRPWLDAGDLELAYRVYASYERSLEKLRSLGARVVPWS